jgi:predicted phosphoadenosine phosphosulfate sulfurtransferase
MRVYSGKNVLEEARDRISYIYDEFPNVVVGFSGGKDSTVVLQLALEVAERKGRLPVRVMFIDQEAEWQSTIDYVRAVFADKRIQPWWIQMPFMIENATSTTENFLTCWDPDRRPDWMRQQEPDSEKVNIYGARYWKELFPNIPRVAYPSSKFCFLGGVRCEESVTRRVALTNAATYKHITYGLILDRKREHYSFYPIYDWAYTDVWKYIHSNRFQYNRLYDSLFQYGVPVRDMRVSNLNHETAVRNLFFLQEVEPDTWNRLAQRLGGIKMAGSLKSDAFSTVRKLPHMFKDWREYRDFLLVKLIPDPERIDLFRRKFAALDKRYDTYPDIEGLYKVQITALLANDWLLTKINNWERHPSRHIYRRMKRDPNYKPYAGDYTETLTR